VAAFDVREIRRGMDVYGRDGAWLGTVIRIEARQGGSVEVLVATYPMSPIEFDGERTGPAPTQAIGNTGPRSQIQAASCPGHGSVVATVERFLIGRWFGVAGRQWIHASRVVNISLERVVVETS
jgi:hypothetical protein